MWTTEATTRGSVPTSGDLRAQRIRESKATMAVNHKPPSVTGAHPHSHPTVPSAPTQLESWTRDGSRAHEAVPHACVSEGFYTEQMSLKSLTIWPFTGDLFHSLVPLPGPDHPPDQRAHPARGGRRADLPIHPQRKWASSEVRAPEDTAVRATAQPACPMPWPWGGGGGEVVRVGAKRGGRSLGHADSGACLWGVGDPGVSGEAGWGPSVLLLGPGAAHL